MLENLVNYENIVMNFYNHNTGSASNQYLNHHHFQFARDLIELLIPFEEGTISFSGSYYPTAHTVLPFLLRIVHLFYIYSDNTIFAPIISEMQLKFLKYYEEIPLFYCLACVLDPKMKLTGVETLIDGFVKFSNSINILNQS